MWPLDRTKNGECLRVGRHAVERWSSAGRGWRFVEASAAPQRSPFSLADTAIALSELCSKPMAGPVTLVVESNWMPVMHVATGGGLLDMGAVQALVRHRFGLAHGPEVAQSGLRIDHRLGDPFALAYALSDAALQSWLAALQQSGARCSAVLPALAWGWQQLQPARGLPRKTGWWAWHEQDRLLLARVQAGRIVALNPGAVAGGDALAIQRLVEAEGVRTGRDAGGEATVASTWQQVAETSPDARLQWRSIAGDEPAVQVAATAEGHA